MPLAEKRGLVLDHATKADALAIGEVMFKAFQVYPFFKHMQPDPDKGVRGWELATDKALADPNTVVLKVSEGDKIIAAGRWVRPAPTEVDDVKEQPGREHDRFPDGFIESCDMSVGGPLFESFDRNHTRWMGTRRHWYMELLTTDPDAHGKGAAGMILKWGCDAADKDGLECYIDSSPMGAGVYESFGWKWETKEEFEHGLSYVYGIRQPQKAA